MFVEHRFDFLYEVKPMVTKTEVVEAFGVRWIERHTDFPRADYFALIGS